MAECFGRALVVDDEAQVRNLTMRMLTREGFSCSGACDGVEAGRMIAGENYDVVVTDLRMPNRHGHALAVDILAMPHRPAIVVLTGMLEPALARDLIARGVDCVEFKPVDYNLFVAKVRVLVMRNKRPHESGAAVEAGDSCHAVASHPSDEGDCDAPPPGLEMVTQKLHDLSQMLPISHTAMEVFQMTASDSADIKHLAAVIAHDPALSVEVLRLANTSYYCPTGKAVVSLDEAVLRIGQKRVGELAVAANALTSMTATVLPWMNADLAWRRSIAAGVALERLSTKTTGAGASEGLFLSAIAHGLGRIALGSIFPQHYTRMVQLCRENLATLREHELNVFPIDQASAMAMLLDMWRLPAAIVEPLKHVDSDYHAIGLLPDALRARVELLKVAILIGRVAVGEWESWDTIEIPPAPTIRRLGLTSIGEVVEITRHELEKTIASHSPHAARSTAANGKTVPAVSPRRVVYLNLSPEPFDFLAALLPAAGIELIHNGPESTAIEHIDIANCMWTPAYRLAARLNPKQGGEKTLILCDHEAGETYHRYGPTLSFPASFGRLAAACQNHASHL